MIIDKGTRKQLHILLEEKQEMLRFDREARLRLTMQIKEHEETIAAIHKILNDEEPKVLRQETEDKNLNSLPANTKSGTVTDEIRRFFEANPEAMSWEVIQHIRERFPKSRINPQSFSIWNGYFKHGKYRMDREKYYLRYHEKSPYEH